MHKVILIPLLCALTVSCTWVKLTPEGESIKLASDEDITNCQLVGRTTVSVKRKVVGIKRSKDKVKEELITMGRNSAARMEGNTIVPETEMMAGEQTFKVFQCVTK